jgi:hypothetical protein
MEAEKLVNLNTTQEAHVQRSETQSVMTNMYRCPDYIDNNKKHEIQTFFDK